MAATDRARGGDEVRRARVRAFIAVVVMLLSWPADARPQAARAQGATPGNGATATSQRRWPSLDISGYVRSLTGIHDAGFDAPGFDRRTGFHGQVARLRWRIGFGESVTLDVHNRLQARLSSTASGFGEAAGIGVSVVPGRPVDLSTHLLDEERVELWHDVDRLALTIRAGRADITAGRQAITWGLAYLFPVADLWAQFSPFELDTEEKPGIDAVRVLAYPAAGLELDGIVAARGRADDWSAGLRATLELPRADVYAAAGKFWDQAMLLGGVAYVLDVSTLRAEAVLPWDLDDGELDRPRVTLGVDRLSQRLRLTAEYHHNGTGVTEPAAYLAQLGSAHLARGETYLLARHYLGGAASWIADRDERLSLSLSALWNLHDGSAALTPVASWNFGQNASVSGGAVQSIGARPTLLPPALESEFGTYGTLWFARVSVYF